MWAFEQGICILSIYMARLTSEATRASTADNINAGRYVELEVHNEELFAKSNWEVLHPPIEEFLPMVKQDDFDSTEIDSAYSKRTAREIRQLHEQFNLFMIASVKTHGETPAEHLADLDGQLSLSIE